MTERELQDFNIQERRLKKLLAKYKALGDKMALPKSPNISGVPGGGGDSEERMDLIIDERTHLKAKIDECRVLRDIAEKKLDRASEHLVTELQTEVFDLLYREGYEISDISLKLKYSSQHIYRQRRLIIDIVAQI